MVWYFGKLPVWNLDHTELWPINIKDLLEMGKGEKHDT